MNQKFIVWFEQTIAIDRSFANSTPYVPSLPIVFKTKKEEQNTVVLFYQQRVSDSPPSCSFEGEDPNTVYNTVANNQRV